MPPFVQKCHFSIASISWASNQASIMPAITVKDKVITLPECWIFLLPSHGLLTSPQNDAVSEDVNKINSSSNGNIARADSRRGIDNQTTGSRKMDQCSTDVRTHGNAGINTKTSSNLDGSDDSKVENKSGFVGDVDWPDGTEKINNHTYDVGIDGSAVLDKTDFIFIICLMDLVTVKWATAPTLVAI